MTTRRWLAATGPLPMLKLVQGKTSSRKLRLAACAFCCHVIDLCVDEGRRAVDVAEGYADGRVGHDELAAARVALEPYIKAGAEYVPWLMTAEDAYEAASEVAAAAPAAEESAVEVSIEASGPGSESFFGTPEQARRKIAGYCVATMRCVFGNPFRPVTVPPVSLTSDVRALAAGIYEERAFDRMPVLADALEDAGCDNNDVLAHCRSDGPHARGCWVVDLLLGKS